jgi:hypothetical protein
MENGSGITKADLISALTDFKTELTTEFKMDLAEGLQKTTDHLMEAMRHIETNLSTEFHRSAKGQQLRLHTVESREAMVTERLAVIEERLVHLESRRARNF